MVKLIRVFLDVDMRNQHDGLARLADNQGYNLSKLNLGEHVIFLNSKLNKLKMYSYGGVLSYLRLPKGRIDLNSIRSIPNAFTAGETVDVAYTDALRKSLALKIKMDV